jgi:hypothetical protein
LSQQFASGKLSLTSHARDPGFILSSNAGNAFVEGIVWPTLLSSPDHGAPRLPSKTSRRFVFVSMMEIRITAAGTVSNQQAAVPSDGDGNNIGWSIRSGSEHAQRDLSGGSTE